MNENARRLLPPLAMLHGFVVAARAGSFSIAAAELGLTQSAISRQIAALEDWIGARLFERVGRRVVLNPIGRGYASEVESALAAIRQATRSAARQSGESAIELATLPSFGMRWLAPRLPRLTEKHPNLIVNFSARADEFSFADEPFDAAIHYGLPDWPGAICDLLFHEAATPVLSSALSKQVTAPRDLTTLPLLVQAARPDAWKHWFAEAGVRDAEVKPSGRFSEFLMLAQAVAAGAGAALIPRFLIGPELASGSLVAPFDISLRSERAYYLVYPKERLGNANFAIMRNWLITEAAMEEDAAR